MEVYILNKNSGTWDGQAPGCRCIAVSGPDSAQFDQVTEYPGKRVRDRYRTDGLLIEGQCVLDPANDGVAVAALVHGGQAFQQQGLPDAQPR